MSNQSTFVNIGERTNVTGSAKFKNLILADDFEGAVEVARQQVATGAQIIDVNMDEGMLDSEAAMVRFLNLIAAEPDISRVPVMIDSSKWSVIEAGLKCVQGRAIVNSISLKEGEAAFLDQARRVRRYGAAMVVMAFDEDGQADTTKRKIEICSRSHALLTGKAGIPSEDIIFDPNIFAVATGLAEHNDYAKAFFEAAEGIKQVLPGVHVSGGLSNVSFSFRGNNFVREAMHSVFLYHAIRAGLDMAIVNAGQLCVYDDIPDDLRDAIEDVYFNRHEDATDRLVELADRYRGEGQKREVNLAWRELNVHDRLVHALVHGIADHVEADTEEARQAAKRALAAPAFVVDVGSAEEWQAERPAGSTHIPAEEIDIRLAELPPGVRIIIVAREPPQAERVVRFLRHRGLDDTWFLHGGLAAWKRAGGATEQG